VAGGKGIDAAFTLQHINLRHRHAGGNGRLFHHVDQLTALRVAGAGFKTTVFPAIKAARR